MESNNRERIPHLIGMGSLFLLLVIPHHTWTFNFGYALARGSSTIVMPLIFSCFLVGIFLGSRNNSPTPFRMGVLIALVLIEMAAVSALSVVGLRELFPLLNKSHATPVVNPIISIAMLTLSSLLAGVLICCQLGSEPERKVRSIGHTRDIHLQALISFFMSTGWTLCFADNWTSDAMSLPILGIAITIAAIVTVLALDYWAAVQKPQPKDILSALWGVLASFAFLESLDGHAAHSPFLQVLPFILAIIVGTLGTIHKATNLPDHPDDPKPHVDCIPSSSKPDCVASEIPWGILSTNEHISLMHALEGKTSAQISEMLGISPSTVRSYLQRAYKKLGVSSLKALKLSLSECPQIPSIKMPPPLTQEKKEASARDKILFVATVACLATVFYLLFLFPATVSILPIESPLLGLALGVLSLAIAPIEGKQTYKFVLIPLRLLQAIPLGYILMRIGVWILDPTLPTPVHDTLFCLIGSMVFGRQLGVYAALLNSSEIYAATTDWRTFALQGLLTSAVICLLISVVPQTCPAIVFASGVFLFIRFMQFEGAAAKTSDTHAPFSRALYEHAANFALPQNTLSALFTLSLGIALTETRTSFVSFLTTAIPLMYLLVVLIIVHAVATRECNARETFYHLLVVLAFSISNVISNSVQNLYWYPIILCGPVFASLIMTLAGPPTSALRRHLAPAFLIWLPAGVFSGNVVSFLSETSAQLSNQLSDLSVFQFAQNTSLYIVFLFWVFFSGAASLILLLMFDLKLVDERKDTKDSSASNDRTLAYLASQGLSPSQCAVLTLIYRGRSSSQIAVELSYSIGTVNSIRYEGYRELRVHSREQLSRLIDTNVFRVQKSDYTD